MRAGADLQASDATSGSRSAASGDRTVAGHPHGGRAARGRGGRTAPDREGDRAEDRGADRQGLAREAEPRPRRGLLLNQALDLVGGVAAALDGEPAGDVRRWRDSCELLSVVSRGRGSGARARAIRRAPPARGAGRAGGAAGGGRDGRGGAARAGGRGAGGLRHRAGAGHGGGRVRRGARAAPGRVSRAGRVRQARGPLVPAGAA